MKKIKISEIAISGGTQQRETINHSEVEIYAESMRCGAQFPPVTLFFDGAQYWLADGFHRFHACRIAEIPDIHADVRTGTIREARLFSAGANGAHGMRLTNADKRKAVMVLLSDAEWGKWGDREIAKHCNVTHPFVGKLRDEISAKNKHEVVTVTTSPPEPPKTRHERIVPDDKPDELNDVCIAKKEPEYTELDAAKDHISDLQDALAVATLAPEDKQISAELIAGLRDEIKTLTATLDAVKSSRDAYQTENAQLKKQVQRQRKEIDKLTGGKTA